MPDGPDQSPYLPISDYAVIGDCHTAALVSCNGRIDWYCPGRFDAPAVFCRILDDRKGGYLQVAPAGDFRVQRNYRGNSNILETRFSTGSGEVQLTDFMPVAGRPPGRHGKDVSASHQLLRLAEGLSGNVELEITFKPTPDYARSGAAPRLATGGAVVDLPGNGLRLVLSAPGVSLEPTDDGSVLRGRYRLEAGERVSIALTDVDTEAEVPDALAAPCCDTLLQQTAGYWQEWSETCSYRGPYRQEVLRSALALKLLTYEPTGALIAAPSCSLPEDIGGVRNWDYRYAWLRDSSRILYALMTIGYQSEAGDFFRWLQRTQQHDPQPVPQIMYRIDGGRDLPEVVLDNLEGYRCSHPVRVGNRASKQMQMDVFGEVLTTAYLHFRAGQDHGGPPGQETWKLLRSLVEDAARRWQEPDNGIWEVRGGPQRFLYSRIMCWAALDRGIRLAQEYGLPAPVEEWSRTRTAIRQAVLEHGYNPQQRAFVQVLDGSALDASVLLISRVGLLPPTDARVRSTIARIHSDLTRDGLVYRYRDSDGLPGGEATFTPCSFWLASALALSGQIDPAHALFEEVVSHANDLGLMSEEIDPESGALLGNFPQGFTHTALIGAAVDLAKATRHGAEQEPENEAQRAGKAGKAAASGYSRK